MLRSTILRTAQPLRLLARSSSTTVQPFHHAFPVHDLDEARKFYGGILKCEEGRSSKTWIDYALYGHQVRRNRAKASLLLRPLARVTTSA